MHILLATVGWIVAVVVLIYLTLGIWLAIFKKPLEKIGIYYSLGEMDTREVPDERADVGTDIVPIHQAIRRIFASAIQQGAEEINFVPHQHHIDVTFFIDGSWQQEDAFPLLRQKELFMELKSMAQVPYYDKNRPQEGKINAGTGGQWFVMPVKVTQVDDTERINIRLIPREPPSVSNDVSVHDRQSKPSGDDEPASERTQIIRTVNGLLASAIMQGASEIKFIPRESQLDVMFLIERTWHWEEAFTKAVESRLISRVKVMADIPYYKRDKAQEGLVQVKSDGQWFDLSVKIEPCEFGESVFIRITPSDGPKGPRYNRP